jgi:hypothetical protein
VCKKIDKVISISIFFAVMLWYTTPGLIGVLVPEVLEYLPWCSLKPPDRFYEAFAIETSAIIVVLRLFLSIRQRQTSRPLTAQGNPAPVLPLKPRLALLVVCLAIALYSAISADTDYVGRSASMVTYDGLTTSTLGKYLSFFSGFALLVVLLMHIEEKHSSVIIIASMTGIAFYSLIIFIGGMRLILILPLTAYFFRYFKNNQQGWSRLMLRASMGLAFVIIISPLLMMMNTLRSSNDSTNITVEAVADGYKSEFLSIVEEYMIKLNSFSPSVILVDNEGMGAAGINPYIGAALVFIPRTLMPDRPVAGSVDGTYAGHPSRLIPRSAGIQSDALTVGATPVYIAMWHFGWFGIPLFIATELMYLLIINRLASSSVFAHRIISLYLLSIPTFHTVFTTPDTVLKSLIETASMLAFLKIISLLSQTKKPRHKASILNSHY